MELFFFFFFFLSVVSLYASILAAQQLNLQNDAGTVSGSIWLNSGTIPRSLGRAMYDRPLQVCNNPRFNTSFVFSIQNFTSGAPRGEGFAFLFSGNLSPAPANSAGPWLGIINPATNRQPSNRIVAVEFDSVQNGEPITDSNDNHVGLDVNQIQSQTTMTLQNSGANGVSLHDSLSNVSVWIDYENGSMTMLMARNSRQRPAMPLVNNLQVDLCRDAAVNEAVYVGFSAATGDLSRDVHIIHAWNFFSSRGDLSFSFEGFGSLRGGAGDRNSQEEGRKRVNVVVVIVIVISSVLMLLLGGGGLFLLCRRMRRSNDGWSSDAVLRGNLEQNISLPSEISYRDLKSATSNFHQRNILGSGGFGSVYVGLLPADGTPVAVKRMNEDSRQGTREFVAEVEIISKLSHRNLVNLRGWCCRSRELLLVYEFMPNGSLDKALSIDSTNLLDWRKRYEIVCGLASALLYLHEECEERIIHRDIKPSNVLLDAEFNARLGDFGLARLIDRRREARTTLVAGTFGYLAPELNVTGQCTTSSDVYSFGIVVLEVASGKRPFFNHTTILVEWIVELYRKKSLIEAADPRLEGRFDRGEMETLLTIGLACSDPNPRSRPTMRQAVHMLRGDGDASLPGLAERVQLRESLEFGWDGVGANEVMKAQDCTDYTFSSSSGPARDGV